MCLGSFAKYSVLQYGQKMIEVRKANDIHHFSGSERIGLAGAHVKAASFVLQKEIFARSLERDDSLDVNAFARREIAAVLRDAFQGQKRFFKRVQRLRF